MLVQMLIVQTSIGCITKLAVNINVIIAITYINQVEIGSG